MRGNSRPPPGRGRGQNRPVKRTPEDELYEEEEDDDFIQRATTHLKIGKIGKKGQEEPIPAKMTRQISEAEWEAAVKVHINDVPAMVDPDTGAHGNIMDESQFKAINSHAKTKIILRQPTVQFKTINSKIESIGEFDAIIQNKYRGTKARISVIRGKMHSLPLLCEKTASELGFVKIDKEGSLNGTNRLKIASVRPEDNFQD